MQQDAAGSTGGFRYALSGTAHEWIPASAGMTVEGARDLSLPRVWGCPPTPLSPPMSGGPRGLTVRLEAGVITAPRLHEDRFCGNDGIAQRMVVKETAL